MKKKAMAGIFFLTGLAILAMAGGIPFSEAQAARIKDIAAISGVRDNHLLGYGMVVGLAGTGDDVKNGFTKESLSNLLDRHGLTMKAREIKADNVAAVMVTASLPPFAKIGAKVDVMVSSIGDAKSLQGGTLLMTALKGTDGQVYAVAQGPIVLGGFSAGGQSGSVTKNHPSVGRIPNGGAVEKELQHDFAQKKSLTINLYRDDFTTARKLESVINAAVKDVQAQQVDSCSVNVRITSPPPGGIMEIVSLIENLDLPVDAPAVVVMNEKTGTVVMGESVRISTVAVAHGNLTIQIKETANVSQPLPFAPQPGRRRRSTARQSEGGDHHGPRRPDGGYDGYGCGGHRREESTGDRPLRGYDPGSRQGFERHWCDPARSDHDHADDQGSRRPPGAAEDHVTVIKQVCRCDESEESDGYFKDRKRGKGGRGDEIADGDIRRSAPG